MMNTRELSTELCEAVKSGNEASVRELLTHKINVNTLQIDNRSLLIFATQAKHEKIALLLLLNGASVDQPNEFGITPLTLAVVKGLTRLCFLLVNNGADFRSANADHQSAWSKAAALGRIDILAFFVSKGLAINESNAQGKTPLMFAAAANQPETVEWLLMQQNIAVFEKDNDGLTAYDLAKALKREAVLKTFDNYFIQQSLVAASERTDEKSNQCIESSILGEEKPSIDVSSSLQLKTNKKSKKKKKKKTSLKKNTSLEKDFDTESHHQDELKEISAYQCGRKIAVPETIKYVLEKLNDLSFTTLCAGDCVRELISGVFPRDYEVVTNCDELTFKEHFANSKQVVSNRCLQMFVSGERVNLTIYPLSDLKEDAIQRDFTVDALYADKQGNVLDPLGSGITDLDEKKLIPIKENCDELNGNPLKFLRAVRFHVTNQWRLPEDMEAHIAYWRLTINMPCAARLHIELRQQFLQGRAVAHFNSLLQTGLFEKLFPATYDQLNTIPYYKEWLLSQLTQTDDCVAKKIPVSFYYILALFYVGEYLGQLPISIGAPQRLTKPAMTDRYFFHNDMHHFITTKFVLDCQDPFLMLGTSRSGLLTTLYKHVEQYGSSDIIMQEMLEVYALNKVPILSEAVYAHYHRWQQLLIMVTTYKNQLLTFFSQWMYVGQSEHEILSWLQQYQWFNEFQQLSNLIQSRNFVYEQLQEQLLSPYIAMRFLEQLDKSESIAIGWRLFFLFANHQQRPLTILHVQPETEVVTHLASTSFAAEVNHFLLWNNERCQVVRKEVLPEETCHHLNQFFSVQKEQLPKLEQQIQKLSGRFLCEKNSNYPQGYYSDETHLPGYRH